MHIQNISAKIATRSIFISLFLITSTPFAAYFLISHSRIIQLATPRLILRPNNSSEVIGDHHDVHDQQSRENSSHPNAHNIHINIGNEDIKQKKLSRRVKETHIENEICKSN